MCFLYVCFYDVSFSLYIVVIASWFHRLTLSFFSCRLQIGVFGFTFLVVLSLKYDYYCPRSSDYFSRCHYVLSICFSVD